MKKTVSTNSMAITQPMWNSSSMVSGCSSVSSVSPCCLTSHSDTRVSPIPIHVLVSKHNASLTDLNISTHAGNAAHTYQTGEGVHFEMCSGGVASYPDPPPLNKTCFELGEGSVHETRGMGRSSVLPRFSPLHGCNYCER